MPSNFKRSEVVAGTTKTQIYGPVVSGVQAIVFSGTFSNLDTTNKSDHLFTLEILNAGAAYISLLKDVPVPYGGSSECPKIVLLPGESLYVTAADAVAIQASVNILERS
jgi:hypothetical protein